MAEVPKPGESISFHFPIGGDNWAEVRLKRRMSLKEHEGLLEAIEMAKSLLVDGGEPAEPPGEPHVLPDERPGMDLIHRGKSLSIEECDEIHTWAKESLQEDFYRLLSEECAEAKGYDWPEPSDDSNAASVQAVVMDGFLSG